MEKKKTLDVRISCMNFVPKWAFLAVKLKKKLNLENEAHFEDVFQICPSMLEIFTGTLTMLTLVISKLNFILKRSKRTSHDVVGVQIRSRRGHFETFNFEK